MDAFSLQVIHYRIENNKKNYYNQKKFIFCVVNKYNHKYNILVIILLTI